ncbi:MAG: GDP-mannose 4,6-dehydratase [Alphaproteobacteria bacterium]
MVTGAAGFVGMNAARALLDQGHAVVGIDNLNPYYSVKLKRDRLARLEGPGFSFVEADIADRAAIEAALQPHGDASHILHLAAQAGVRHSLVDPYAYVASNVMGQLVLLEAARRLPRLERFVYASTSSVYGALKDIPFSVRQCTDKPVSIYAATKLGGEHLARVYADSFGIACVGLRFFTVYGPWGRPDMATWLFTEAILQGRPIPVFNNGDMRRDFTYVDDIVAGICGALTRPLPPDSDGLANRIYNLGNHRAEALLDFIGVIERCLGRKAELRMEPMQQGDVRETFADIAESRADLGFAPKVTIDEGIPRFIDWYRSYHNLS